MIFTEFQLWVFFAVAAALHVVLPHRAQSVAGCPIQKAQRSRVLSGTK